MNFRLKTLAGCLLTLLVLAGCATAPRPTPRPVPVPAPVRPAYERVEWSRVDGWTNDATHEAWGAFLNSCRARGSRPEWQQVCSTVRAQPAWVDPAGARAFFESQFDAYHLQKEADDARPRDSGLITGYYEPLLFGARKPAPGFTVPLYAPPDNLLTIDLSSVYPELKGKTLRGRIEGKKVVPYYTRAELDNSPLLNGKEIAWVDNALDAFYLQVQGSGRVQFSDGQTVRFAYADQNGYPYRSIGRYLVDKGELTVAQATAQGIRDWIQAHPSRTREVLNANPSMVFFRMEDIADPTQGPKGALAVPLTPGRSLAVDPAFIPLGAPVFLSTTYPGTDTPLQRLMMAQDTGGAIKGLIRADFFWGFGKPAGESAGRMRQDGQMWILWPKGQLLPNSGAGN